VQEGDLLVGHGQLFGQGRELVFDQRDVPVRSLVELDDEPVDLVTYLFQDGGRVGSDLNLFFEDQIEYEKAEADQEQE
jgi:hypothetical protein